jgi:RND family efflux transporter MFP subunit
MKSQISLLALFLLVTACGNNGADDNSANDAPKNVASVYVKELKPASFNHYLTILGNVESDKTIMVTPKASANVEKIMVRAGDRVKKGDVLAKLDGEITRSQIQQVKTQLELAKTMYERQKNLREKNIGSEVQFLQAKTQYESTKNQLATLNEQYENYTIRAAISGTVNMVDLKVGEHVGPGTPVFQLANSDALKVKAAISEAYISRVDESDSVEIIFPSLNESIHKTLDVVSKVINPSNRTFGIEIHIPNKNGSIRPNMMAKVKINDITLSDKIVVPVNVVQNANGKNLVFIAEEKGNSWAATAKEVVTSYSYNNSMVISEGLNAGELLITAGYGDLSSGQPISIQEEN